VGHEASFYIVIHSIEEDPDTGSYILTSDIRNLSFVNTSFYSPKNLAPFCEVEIYEITSIVILVQSISAFNNNKT
jgi:hypothetical protein